MMGNLYATTTEVKAYLAGEAQRADNDTRILDALNTACRAIDAHCGRQFWQVVDNADSATTRTFHSQDGCTVMVDDFYTTTGLVVATDTSDNGTADTTWDSTDYELYPLNGVVHGKTGWPYDRIVAVDSRRFPYASRRSRVHVTAKWGWNAVPSEVKQATLQLTSTIFKMEHAPLGVAALGEFGPLRVPMDTLRYVKAYLDPFCRTDARPVVL